MLPYRWRKSVRLMDDTDILIKQLYGTYVGCLYWVGRG